MTHQPGANPSNAELLTQAWADIVPGVWESGTNLPQSWELLESMQRPAAPGTDPQYWEGQLALAHRPFFDTWAANGDLTQTEINLVRGNIATVLEPFQDPSTLLEADDQVIAVVLRGVVSSLFLRQRAKDGVVDPRMYISYPAPPDAGETNFVAEDDRTGTHHLYVLTPHDSDPVPVVVSDTAGKQTGTDYRESDGAMAIGIGPLVTAKIRKLGAPNVSRATRTERLRSVATVIGFLVAEADPQRTVGHEHRRAMTRVSQALVDQADAFHTAHRN